MPFRLLGALLTTYRSLSYLTPSWPLSILPAAQNLLATRVGTFCPDPQLEPPRYFTRSQVRGRCRSHAQIPRIQVFGAGDGAGPFSRNGSCSRNFWNNKLGAGAKSRTGMLPWSRIRSFYLTSPAPHPCFWPYSAILGHSKSSWLPDDLLANQCSLVLSTHFWLLTLSVRLGKCTGTIKDCSMDPKQ